MKTLDCITVALSLSESDDHLLAYASMLVGHGIGHQFHFVHVVARDSPAPAHSPEQARQRLAELVQSRFALGAQGLELSSEVREGVRVDELLSCLEQRSSGLVLLGHRRNRSGKRTLARRLAMLSPASVWMVPDQVPCRISRVLAPIDFSAHSADSLSLAAGIAARTRADECLALHVFFDPSTIRYDEHERITVDQMQQVYEQFVRPVNLHQIAVEPVFEESSNVTHAILRVAERRQSDLVVMNTRGRSAAASILLGSETSQTLMGSPVPVLAIKHRGARMNLFQVLCNSELWSRFELHTN